VGHTVDLFSLPTAVSTPAEAIGYDKKVEKAPPAEPALPTPKEPSPSVRPCKNRPRIPPSELLLMQLPPAVPVFISEIIQPPPAQVSTLSEEFVPPAAIDVDEELAELNGCGVRQPLFCSLPGDPPPSAAEHDSSVQEFLLPDEPPGGFDLEALADLLDMRNDRLPACWPQGFDAFTAKAVLMRANGHF